MALLSVLNKVKTGVSNNSQTIFAITATAGVLITVVTAAEGGIKATKLLDQYIEENQEPDCEFVPTKLETAKVVAPAFKNAMISAGLTITSIWLSWKCHDNKLSNALLGLNGMHSLLTSTRDDFAAYRDKNIELNGQENHEKIQEEVTKDRFESARDMIADRYGNKVFKVYEPVCKQTFYCDLHTLVEGEKAVNEIFHKLHTVSMYDFYTAIGQKAPATAKDYGWSMTDSGYDWFHGYTWIDMALTLYSDYNANDCCDIGWSIGPFDSYLDEEV